MKATARDAAVPAYLFACLIAGGSAQGLWNNAALQLLGVALIGWSAYDAQPPSRPARSLLLLAAATLALIVVQLLPLPPPLWTSLPGRGLVESGYPLLGYPLPWLPLSLDPYDTLAASYALLPPIAILAAMLARPAVKQGWIAAAVLAAALASVVLGAAQAAGGAPRWWTHFYSFTSPGVTGFFANRNHMATLLLAAIPFAAAIYVAAKATMKQRQKAFAMLAFGVGGMLLLVAGIALNASLAALALAVPVIALSGLLVLPAGSRTARMLGLFAGVAFAAAVVAISSSSIRTELAGGAGSASFHSRAEIWSITGRAIADSFPAGTGVGTFRQVYALHEAPASVTNTYVNHAHNDYLEIVLEAGLAGLLLLAAFLAWWALQAVRVWRTPSTSPFARAATIASAAILAHSSVDYPLRSAAIAAVFAACLGLMAVAGRQSGSGGARHVTIG